jgi:predicted cupin superfamily sugar epimerase
MIIVFNYDYNYNVICWTLNEQAKYWIEKLNLRQHPEGGFFIETYKSEKYVNLPEYDGPRHACTAIYYLLIGDQFSSFHRIKSDEMWHFYAGSSLSLHVIEGDGDDNIRLNEIRLGSNIDNKETFQAVIKSGSWFAASVADHNSYGWVGCTISPGFDYRDWELGELQTLKRLYPQYKSIIEKYAEPISKGKGEASKC